jgi:hypothetical protein
MKDVDGRDKPGHDERTIADLPPAPSNGRNARKKMTKAAGKDCTGG